MFFAHLIANIPGVVGYFPHDALVVVGLNIEEDGAHVGPVAVADAEHVTPEMVGEVIDMQVSELDYVVAVAVGGDAIVSKMVDVVAEANSPDRVEIVALAALPEIVTGEPYEVVYAQPEFGFESAGNVAMVATSQSMLDRVSHGETVALTREEGVEEVISPTVPDPDGLDVAAVAASAHDTVDAFENGDADNPERLDSLERTITRWLASAEGRSVEDLESDTAVLNAGAFLMGASRIRDMALRDIIAYPDAATVALQALARHSDTEVRSNALACAAIAEIARANRGKMDVLLIAARTVNGEHGLTDLLSRAAATRHDMDFMIEAALLGAAESWASVR